MSWLHFNRKRIAVDCSHILFQFVQELFEASRVCAHESINNFSALDEYESWHCRNVVLGSSIRIFVDTGKIFKRERVCMRAKDCMIVHRVGAYE